MAGEMSGPTLPDLENQVGANTEEISRALTGKSFGKMFFENCFFDVFYMT